MIQFNLSKKNPFFSAGLIFQWSTKLQVLMSLSMLQIKNDQVLENTQINHGHSVSLASLSVYSKKQRKISVKLMRQMS